MQAPFANSSASARWRNGPYMSGSPRLSSITTTNMDNSYSMQARKPTMATTMSPNKRTPTANMANMTDSLQGKNDDMADCRDGVAQYPKVKAHN